MASKKKSTWTDKPLPDQPPYYYSENLIKTVDFLVDFLKDANRFGGDKHDLALVLRDFVAQELQGVMSQFSQTVDEIIEHNSDYHHRTPDNKLLLWKMITERYGSNVPVL